MNFYEIYSEYRDYNFDNLFSRINENEIFKILDKQKLDITDFISLLSPIAYNFIETMAKKANEITLKYFGKVIQLYTPLYLSNFCDNECVYCGFKHTNNINRKMLSFEELEKEAKIIFGTGIRHILILTGESRKKTPVSYLKECVLILSKYFSSISVEVYPLETNEYKELVSTGVDGITIYQETYDESLYKSYHLRGKKTDYLYRLSTPERACDARFRTVNIGALLGLSEFRKEMFFTGLHAVYLQNNYPDTEISVSFPRIRPQTGDFVPAYTISDRELVQFIIAVRLFLPRVGINISTRESKMLRNNLIGLGITKMSAGSNTAVGGYSQNRESERQFDVVDRSSVKEVKDMICLKGYQPIMKDWNNI
ncbi:MAG: 2-iminoacetate synthase ThiH [Elusimicrobia bacterium]|nr:2-iminoacetate synthase ThiH [Elusimicrobiota bacterium]